MSLSMQATFGSHRALLNKGPRRTQRSSRQSLLVEARATKSKNAAMVCVDCGYIYDGENFDALPSSYACPACSASKKRFKAFNGSTSKKNDSKSMIARRTQLREQLEESGEKVEEDAGFLYVTGASALVLLGIFYYVATSR
ncbi:hypothetical protein CEUSTIGMA_g9176.t1 [Chlamydomonas eustigma]|uniref:Rubredoxin-like domain-containing protein n=1 Tax=Chlamydomonas eustigma TaxID=1157962 RepID=A0A250XF85_9CHLO|nr:hypothetical protein CEUSTIGMA_g9176.t1 [Chlamydomonas eustigma]|eukprot:GAX81748.1 hypothetical protein CEUSTIGMA_g9176.t1 [Chlamydomonas eustigma]